VLRPHNYNAVEPSVRDPVLKPSGLRPSTSPPRNRAPSASRSRPPSGVSAGSRPQHHHVVHSTVATAVKTGPSVASSTMPSSNGSAPGKHLRVPEQDDERARVTRMRALEAASRLRKEKELVRQIVRINGREACLRLLLSCESVVDLATIAVTVSLPPAAEPGRQS
jgi:hypothetical protein